MSATSKPALNKNPSEAVSRHVQRRLRTREAIITAARQVMAEKGLEGAAISEITERADVGNGSFYNHFSSKEEVMEEAAYEMLIQLADDVDAVIADIEDPAEAQAVALRRTFEFHIRNPEFGWFVLKNALTSEVIDRSLEARIERDLSRGVKAGRYVIPNVPSARIAIKGIFNAALVAILRGRAKKKTINDAILLTLKML